MFTLINLSAIKYWIYDCQVSARAVFDYPYCTLIKGGQRCHRLKKRAILQVRIREDDKQHAERLYDAMGTSLAEAVRLFVAQSILMRKLPFQPVAVRSKDGTAAYGSLKAYGDPNRRSEERNAWIEYLATESDDSVLGPEEVDIHE